MLPLDERVKDLVSRFTTEEKISLMMQYQPEITRLGISAYKQGTEAAHGVAWLGEATVFPQTIGLSQTWNRELLKKIGNVISDEARVYHQKNPASHGLTLWAPTVDMERDPRWGRTEEAYGEDPYLTGELSKELVKGMQGEDPCYLKTVATLKHFIGNNNEEQRTSCSASIDPRNMYEYYLQAFKPAIVEGKAKSIMTAYNSINGTPAPLHPFVKQIVKEEWQMDGFIVSDAGDVVGIVDDHHYYDNYPEALADAIKSGIDSITDDEAIATSAIREALAKGLLDEKHIDEALFHTFQIRFRLGEFDPELDPYANIPPSKLLAKEHAELSKQAALEQIVLLKNDNVLPLQKEIIQKIAVIGPLANEVHVDWYSGTPAYQVTPFLGIKEKLSDSDVQFANGYNTVHIRSTATGYYVGLDGETNQLVATKEKEEAEMFEFVDWGFENQTLRSMTNGRFVTVSEKNKLEASAEEARGWFVKECMCFTENEDGHCTWQTWEGQFVSVEANSTFQLTKEEKLSLFEIEVVENGLETATELAKQADVAIVFVGNNPFINGKECIDRKDICLAPEQTKLIQAVKKVNKKTVVVTVSSYPYALNWEQQYIPAILATSHAGPELGNAIADVLFGDYNPAGRLSLTWYRSSEQLPSIMDYDIIKGKRTYQYFDGDVLYPFGYGLSYTTFAYKNMKIRKGKVENEDYIFASVTIKNIGAFSGDEVVQLYVKANKSRVKRPLKTLCGFQRLTLNLHEEKEVVFAVPVSSLAIWDVTRERYCVEKGEYTFIVGPSSNEIRCSLVSDINGEVIPPRDGLETISAINYDDYDNIMIVEVKNKTYCIKPTERNGWLAFFNIDFRNVSGLFEAIIENELDDASLELRVGSRDGEWLGTCTAYQSKGWKQISMPVQVNDHFGDVYLFIDGPLKLRSIRFS
uniref:glycoside hydrolase family 3 protein n=1 Tax=Alkalihalobacterium bogoriense TaxID=246272 RepID=UPI000686F4A7